MLIELSHMLAATKTAMESQGHVYSDKFSALTSSVSDFKRSTTSELSNCREILSSVTKQVLSLQSQLNDQSDDVFGKLEEESQSLRSICQSYSDGLNTITGTVVALEQYMQKLSSSIDDLSRESQRHDRTINNCTVTASEHSQTNSCDQLREEFSKLVESKFDAFESTQSTKIQELNEVITVVDSASKQRISSIEQRMIRQEALSREKLAELEGKLLVILQDSSKGQELETHISGVRSILESHQQSLDELMGVNGDVAALRTTILENNEQIKSVEAELIDRIEQVQINLLQELELCKARDNASKELTQVVMSNHPQSFTEQSLSVQGTALNIRDISSKNQLKESEQRNRDSHIDNVPDSDDENDMKQFQTMIETVNFDIATLGAHLEQFHPESKLRVRVTPLFYCSKFREL